MIRVISPPFRGQFGTNADSYPLGVYLAPHVRNGPWKRTPDQILWNYNFSRASTREHLAAVLKSYFSAGGPLFGTDGVTLDVSWWYESGAADANASQQIEGRLIDINTDGIADQGYAGTTNLYGRGVLFFHHLLRTQLGSGKVIFADGGGANSSRDFHVTNGSENEGIGAPNDPEFSAWSTGLNMLGYDFNRTTTPSFRYVVHKAAPGAGSARLAMAASTIFEAAFANVVNPITDIFSTCTRTQWDEQYNRNGLPVLDEMVRGAAAERHWLGAPAEPLRRLVLDTPTVHPANVPDLRTLLTAPTANTVAIVNESARTVLTPVGTAAPSFAVEISGLTAAASKDVTLELEVLALAPLDGFPGDTEIPRAIEVTTTAGVVPAPASGTVNATKQSGLFGPQWTPLVFYFRNESAQSFTLRFNLEGRQQVAIRNMRLHHAPDLLARRFEHGLVLANPSFRDATFNLRDLYPDRHFERITATSCQDTQYNDGRIEGAIVTLGPKDGLFLRER